MLIPSLVDFCDGLRTINAAPFLLSNDPRNRDFWVIRQSPRLLDWHKKYSAKDVHLGTNIQQSSPPVVALSGLLDSLGRETAGHIFEGDKLVPEIGNVILRDTQVQEVKTSDSYYTNSNFLTAFNENR